ncbi:MAG: hypothetical protein OXU42_04100 [Deltaproteobacteria bacterium]|nr:hypothetical protein [Deltaproteobacteria bacterium]
MVNVSDGIRRMAMAVVLAVSLSGCGGGGGEGSPVRPPDTGVVPPDTEVSIDWWIEGPLTGVASGEAHDALEAAQRRVSPAIPGRDTRTFGSQIYAVDAAGNTGNESFAGFHLALPSNDTPYGQWGFWNHSRLSPDIAKVQWRYSPRYEDRKRRAVYGILDYGLFWILDTENDGGEGGSVAGFSRSLSNQLYAVHSPGHQILSPAFPDFFPRPNRSLADPVGPHGATWTGDALGFSKTTRKTVYGPAELTVTGASTVPVDVYYYAMRLQIDLNNGDRLIFNDLTGTGSGDKSFSSPGNHHHPFQQDRAQGMLLRSADDVGVVDVVGAFETADYIGAFGAKRK